MARPRDVLALTTKANALLAKELPRQRAATKANAVLAEELPRRRVAKLLDAVGLGHYEPEAIAEIYVREKFGGRRPRPRQRKDAELFGELLFLTYGIEIYGFDIPVDSFHRRVFDLLTVEQIEELLLLHWMLRRLVRDAAQRVNAVSDQPVRAWLMRRNSAKGSIRRTRGRCREGRPGTTRHRGSRRTASTRAGPSSKEPPDEPHSSGLSPLLSGSGRMTSVQTRLAVGGFALPVDPVRLAAENVFEVRHVLRTLELDDEQIAAAEQAVELVRLGVYPRSGA